VRSEPSDERVAMPLDTKLAATAGHVAKIILI